MKTMHQGNSQRLSVHLLDENRAVVTGATVTANLVDGSSASVPHATNLTMAESSTTPGLYSVVVAATFNPPIATNYTLQLTALSNGRTLYGEAAVAVRKRVIP